VRVRRAEPTWGFFGTTLAGASTPTGSRAAGKRREARAGKQVMTVPPPSTILPLSRRNFLNVPETNACAKSMESMINLDGANLIFGTSFGNFDPFMIDLAKKYAKGELRHVATLWDAAKHPKNLGSYFGFLNQAHFVDGVAAGRCTKSNRIGFVVGCAT
jgi:hypothetical protein